MDRLAAQGRVFGSARAHAVVTLPSHASILTGLFPFQHRVHDNAGFVLGEGFETMATLLAGDGYATAAFVSALPLDRRYGLGRGFDVYDDEYDGYGGGVVRVPERPGEETVARAKAWWSEHEGERRFLWVHLFTPHFPYDPVEPFASRHRDRPYFGDVAMADAQIEPLLGPFLDGREPSALVILTSDHGEALGEHGEQTHGTFVYDSTLRVPLVVWAPDLLRAGVDESPAWHVDLLPTVLDVLGLDPGGPLPGRSLLAPPEAGSASGSYFEALAPYFNRGWAPLVGRMEGDLKAIRLPIPELYDLREDPEEARNLAEVRRPEMDALLSGLPAMADLSGSRKEVDPEVLAKLRSLGYVAANRSPGDAPSFDAAHDPKNLVDLESLLDGALTVYRNGDLEGAVRVLEDLLRRQPDMVVAYAHLGQVLTDLGRVREAIDLLTSAQQNGISSESTRRTLALALLRDGRAARAAGVLRTDHDSGDPETLAARGRIAAQMGELQGARALFREALRIDPTYPAVEVDLATLDMMEGRFADAGRLLERALASDAYLAEGWNALGVVRSKEGKEQAAIEAWSKAVSVDPRLPDALYNLALARERNGAFASAAESLERYSGLVEGDERERALEMLRELRGRAGRSAAGQF